MPYAVFPIIYPEFTINCKRVLSFLIMSRIPFVPSSAPRTLKDNYDVLAQNTHRIRRTGLFSHFPIDFAAPGGPNPSLDPEVILIQGCIRLEWSRTLGSLSKMTKRAITS